MVTGGTRNTGKSALYYTLKACHQLKWLSGFSKNHFLFCYLAVTPSGNVKYSTGIMAVVQGCVVIGNMA